MPEILVLRHAKAIANEQHILMGSSLKMDSNLSELGIKMAHAKGAELRKAAFKPDRVYSSELARAKQTTEIILMELGLDLDITQLAALNERHFGQYEGRPTSFVIDAFDKYAPNPPSVEPTSEFIARVLDGFNKIKEEKVETILIVTHSNPLRVIEAAIFDPDGLQKFWKLGDPEYCQGFKYTT
jgi:probable phosphoglycerate mutase